MKCIGIWGKSTPVVYYASKIVGPFKLYRNPVPRSGMLQLAPGQNQDGYGNKIQTDYVLVFNGEKRQHRVYCICWSNAGSNYIIRGKDRLYLETFYQSEIEDLPG